MIDNHIAIYVAVLNQGEVRTEVSQFLNQLTHNGQFPVIIDYPAGKPISYNRNQIVKKFLAQKDYDYLLMLDGDIVPPLNILQLALYDKDIIGGLCFSFSMVSVGHTAIIPLILKRNKKKNPGEKFIHYVPIDQKKWNGLTECDAVGTGCIMIKRSILEDERWTKTGGWFVNEYDKTGDKKTGLDINFCKRAKKMKYNVFCHTDMKCSHWTPMNLLMIYNTIEQIVQEKNEDK